MINSFDKEFAFLSNFFECTFKLYNHEWRSAEHAYQALKCTNEIDFLKIKNAPTPAKAKQLAKKVELRSEWNDEFKIKVMKEVLKEKFTQNVDLKEALLATNNVELIEGNWWGDVFWGICKGEGQNNLGKLLMELRETLRNQ